MARAARVGWLCAGLAVGGCGGGYPEPKSQLQASQVAVEEAVKAGARLGPTSRKYLNLAVKQVEEAVSLVQNGEYERADWLLLRAQADAELALALANEEQDSKGEAASRTPDQKRQP
jgi:hypothetical protein